MFSAIWEKIKEILKKMLGTQTIQEAVHVVPAISSEMADAIELWQEMYENKAPWLHEATYADPVQVSSLGLPQLIASEKARIALIEFDSQITTPTEETEQENPNYAPPAVDENGVITPGDPRKTTVTETPTGDTARADYLNDQYKKLKKQLRTQIEYGIAGGGLIIKPYIIMNDNAEEGSNDEEGESVDLKPKYKADIGFDFVQADAFFPLAFDSSNKITEAAFVQRKVDKDYIYSRLEHHKYANGKVTVINKAYKASSSNSMDLESGELGTEISLKEVPEWADIKPKTTVGNVDRLMFAYFKMPEANTVDRHSPLGVSGYSRAVDLIKEADKQYSRVLWEFEALEAAIDIDRDALNEEVIVDGNGVQRTVKTLGIMQQRLFRQIDLGESDTYKPFTPAIRDTSLLNGLNAILMRIEDTCGLARGTLSDAAAEARTATEIRILKQRTYQTNKDIQQAIEDCLEDVIYIMNVYTTLYNVVPKGEYNVSYDWDDSVLEDKEEELNKKVTLLHEGIASKLELRMWYFGETKEQAMQALAQVDAESQQAMAQNLQNMKMQGDLVGDIKAKQELGE